MKYCKNCGKQCEDGENFCRMCGNAVGGSLDENEGVSGDTHDASAVQNTYDDFAVRQGNSEPPAVGNNVAAAVLDDYGTQHTGNGASDNNQSFDRPNDRPYDQPCDCPVTDRWPEGSLMIRGIIASRHSVIRISAAIPLNDSMLAVNPTMGSRLTNSR